MFPADFGKEFLKIHKKEFQFLLPRDILIDDVRVRGIGLSNESRKSEGSKLHAERVSTVTQAVDSTIAAAVVNVYFEETGRVSTPVYLLGKLAPGTLVHGPAIVIDDVRPFSDLLPNGRLDERFLCGLLWPGDDRTDSNATCHPWSDCDDAELARCY